MRCWSDAIAGHMLSIVLISWFLPGDCSMAAQPNKVRISYSSRSNSNTPFIIALNKGFFVEEGMDVELIQVNPRLGATAVLNGDLDFTTTFGTTLRGIIGGFPIKFVAVAVKKSEHFLVARPEIKEIRELSGKKLGVATLFGSDQRAAEEMIRGKGFSRRNDEADCARESRRCERRLCVPVWSTRFRFHRHSISPEIRRLSRPGGPARRPDGAAHVRLGGGQSRVAAEPAARQTSGARLDEVPSLRVREQERSRAANDPLPSADTRRWRSGPMIFCSPRSAATARSPIKNGTCLRKKRRRWTTCATSPTAGSTKRTEDQITWTVLGWL